MATVGLDYVAVKLLCASRSQLLTNMVQNRNKILKRGSSAKKQLLLKCFISTDSIEQTYSVVAVWRGTGCSSSHSSRNTKQHGPTGRSDSGLHGQFL